QGIRKGWEEAIEGQQCALSLFFHFAFLRLRVKYFFVKLFCRAEIMSPGGLIPYLSVSPDDPFVGSEFVKCHGSTGMKFLCADAYFRSHTKLAAIGKSSRGIGIDCCRID